LWTGRRDTGSGKERVARAVHELSGRTGAFVSVNCGALPATMVEATLFGHGRGSFSGAIDDLPGLFRAADRGTLFLDEVGELPFAAQAAPLRAVQEHEVTPIGETRPLKVNVRIVAATNQDLAQRVARGDFRQDLLARLAGYEFRMPPLAQRIEDLGLILRAVVRARAPQTDALARTQNVARALLGYRWPSNVRGLEHVIAAAHALSTNGVLQSTHLPDRLRGVPSAVAAVGTPTMPVAAQYAPDRAALERREGRGGLVAARVELNHESQRQR
jgi:transcriptional regulator with GAF, ATPase, and Fis domain